MKHLLFASFLGFFCPLFLEAQVIKTNENGVKIIEYPDGTWEYFVEKESDDPLAKQNKANRWEEADPEKEAEKKAIRYAEQLSADAAQLEMLSEEARLIREQLEDELDDMKSRPGQYSTLQLQDMERRLAAQRSRETLSRTLYQQAYRLAQNADNLGFIKKPKKRDKALKQLEQSKAELDRQVQSLRPRDKQAPPPAAVAVKDKTYKPYDPLKDTRVTPPTFPCNLTFNQVDKFTGKMRREMQPVVLFSHTPKELRAALRDREYIVCRGFLADLSDGLLFLSLEFSIASNNARVAFGGIPGGSVLSILLMNGETARLVNSKSDAGVFDAKTGQYTYRSQFQISGVNERLLQSAEIDKMRVIWATGYEDYEVFELDFFRNQINCLRGAN
jgi:hypothetical protein